MVSLLSRWRTHYYLIRFSVDPPGLSGCNDLQIVELTAYKSFKHAAFPVIHKGTELVSFKSKLTIFADLHDLLHIQETLFEAETKMP